MAKNFHLNTSVDWDADANWSLGAEPVDTNEVIIERGSEFDLTANLDQRTGDDVDLALLRIAGTFTKSIGNGSTQILMLDDVTRLEIEAAGGGEQILTLDLDGCATVAIRRTSSNAMAVYLIDGSYVDIYMSSGNLMLGAAAAVTGGLYLTSEEDGRLPPVVRMLQGFTISGELMADAGMILSQAAIGASRTMLSGGAILKQYGGSTVDIANTVFMFGQSKLWIATQANAVIGKVDATDNAEVDSRMSSYQITYTASRVRSRSIIHSKSGVDVFTAATVIAGGSVPAVGGSIQIPGK